jgi:hypothetical protein
MSNSSGLNMEGKKHNLYGSFVHIDDHVTYKEEVLLAR